MRSPDASIPLITVVVPTCERPEQLAACLDRLAVCIRESGRDDVEVLVGDDSRGDASRRMVAARHPWVTVVPGPRGGPARNRNHAATHAAGRWLAFTDDDCLPDPRWLAELCAAIGSGEGERVLEGRTRADRAFRRLDEDAPVNEHGGNLWACNMAVERALFVRLGGFCEAFPHAFEDMDFRLRVLKAGESIRFLPAALVVHPIRRAKGLRFQSQSVRSFQILAARHPEILGARPASTALLNLLRRVRGFARAALRMRLRGAAFQAGAVAIQTYAEFLAVATTPPVARPATGTRPVRVGAEHAPLGNPR